MLWLIAIATMFILLAITAQLRGYHSTESLPSTEAERAVYNVAWER